jgi:DNA-binding transcriptional LysR family regulator
MHYTLRQLRSALAVAQHRSFRRAAEDMHLSQPALSLSVAELESSLGVTLFDRTSRMVRPTQVGEAFFSGLERTLQDLDQLVREVGDIAQSRRGRVVVSSIASVAGKVMPSVVMACEQRYPQLDLTVRDDVATRVLEVVRFGEADFGVWAQAPGVLPEDLEFEKILDEAFYLVCSRTHRFARKRQVAWADLNGESYIAFSASSGANAEVAEQILRSRVVFGKTFSAAQLATVHAMLETPLGISILPRMALPADHHPILTFKPLVSPVLHRSLGFVRRKDRSLSPAAEAVKGVLLETLKGGRKKT